MGGSSKHQQENLQFSCKYVSHSFFFAISMHRLMHRDGKVADINWLQLSIYRCEVSPEALQMTPEQLLRSCHWRLLAGCCQSETLWSRTGSDLKYRNGWACGWAYCGGQHRKLCWNQRWLDLFAIRWLGCDGVHQRMWEAVFYRNAKPWTHASYWLGCYWYRGVPWSILKLCARRAFSLLTWVTLACN